MFYIREKIIKAFKRGIFPDIDGIKVEKEFEKESGEKSEEESQESKEELYENEFFKNIEDESKYISYELFKKHFNYVEPIVLAKNYLKEKIKTKILNL